MAKNLKINIKNAQIAEALSLGGIKSKLTKKPASTTESAKKTASSAPKPTKAKRTTKKASEKVETPEVAAEEMPRVRARSRSAFDGSQTQSHEQEQEFESITASEEEQPSQEQFEVEAASAEEISTSTFSEKGQEEQAILAATAEESESAEPTFEASAPAIEPEIPALEEAVATEQEEESTEPTFLAPEPSEAAIKTSPPAVKAAQTKQPTPKPVPKPALRPSAQAPRLPQQPLSLKSSTQKMTPLPVDSAQRTKLGPTGKHIRDLVPTKKPMLPPTREVEPLPAKEKKASPPQEQHVQEETKAKGSRVKVVDSRTESELEEEMSRSKKGLKPKFREFRDIKPLRKKDQKTFDARDRQGLRGGEEEGTEWRKRRTVKSKVEIEDTTLRPTHLKVRVPIQIKDLASEMKLKASQLVGKLFMSGTIMTLNDFLDDETTIQLLGQEFGCEITIDTSEEERIKVTSNKIREEILASESDDLTLRAPVVAFMGHVDHGKTSLIDAIRSSNRAAGEAGAITQHIGAFRCHTAVGDITVLDTPGHEAFSAMRARGADVTDIVVLVVAGDEGLRQQSIEAIQHAKAANVTIVVAINKCDKPNFDPDTVYRQLSENQLLPEAWGGNIITVNCSAVTKEGISTLLEMLALQAEVLELKANEQMRARGTVLETQMHKGLGAVTTLLVQNGTLHHGDAVVFGQTWGHVKTLRNEYGKPLEKAGPSTPVEMTGLSGLPSAGEEFVVVKDDKEARSIAEARSQGVRERAMIKAPRATMENILQAASTATEKKILNLVLRADVQGSLEALKVALEKIESEKATLNIIFTGVGEISESDVQLAAASKAAIIGFHTRIEGHAESLVKQYEVNIRLHDIIYHAIDDVKAIMTGMLDRIAQETEKGKALVKATFKSSHSGLIAGCEVTEGSIHRNHHVRVMREGKELWKGTIGSLKRVKDDVREVAKGLECGIVFNGFTEMKEGDIIESFEVTYITQEL